MKPKKGKCIDCPSDAPQQYLTAKRCQKHYWLHRQKVNQNKKHNVERKQVKAGLNVFFASQVPQIPATCEECTGDIRYWREKNPRMLVAHILPKRKTGGFPSVSMHPQNRVFLCPDCHTQMDNKGEDFVKKMKIYPIMIERLKKFAHCITEKTELPNGFANFVKNNDNERDL